MTKKSGKEYAIKDEIKKILSRFSGITWFMPQSGLYGRSGVGDFVCCVNGKYLEIEAKSLGCAQSALQVKRQKVVGAAKGRYLRIDGETSLQQLDIWLVFLGATLKQKSIK